MTQEDKDIVIAEIERLKSCKLNLEEDTEYLRGYDFAIDTIEEFITSLPAEQPSERLGDEIDHFRCSDEFALAKRAGEEVAATARHFAQWQKEQSTKLLKTIYSDCDNLKKDLDRVTTGNLPHRIGNIKFSITGIQVIIKQAMEDEQ